MRSWDHDALWIKAKMFLGRAMDDDDRSFDERAFWATQALELLGKAALSRVHPALIAVPSDDGVNVLMASGLVEGTGRFVSISASTLFKRCERAFRPFDAKEAVRFASARNEYLHGAGVGVAALPAGAWWPRYWSLASVLINALDRQVSDLVGLDRVPVVEAYLDKNKKNVEHRTEMLIERARQRRAQYDSGALTSRVASEWKPGTDVLLGLGRYGDAVCPACENLGTLEGEEVVEAQVEHHLVRDDDYELEVTLTVEAEAFACEHCGLVLHGVGYLVQAGLDTTFTTPGGEDDVIDWFEPEYGND